MRPPTEGAEPPRENLSTETIMAGVRLRVRQQIGWEQPGAGTANAYDEVKRVFQASQETLRPLSPFYPQVLGSEDMWEVPTPLVFETHRGVLGRVLIWVKRRVLFPLNRWLHGYVWHNLRRQQDLNLRLLAAVESLAVSHARLQEEVEALQGVRSSNRRRDSPEPESPVPKPPPRDRLTPVRSMKLVFVVDRYGPEVAGGAERHCRDFAKRLAERGHEVTVLTSCAQDYIRWTNTFPAGEEKDGLVTVRRFPVTAERNLEDWHHLSRRVFAGLGSEADERRWFELSGPLVPALVDHLRAEADRHDLFIFFSYRYFPTFNGLPVVARRAILVPTAEEDPAIRLGVLRKFFTLPLGIVHNSVEEHQLIRSVTRAPFPAFEVIGSGVDEAAPPLDSSDILTRLGVRSPFILCLGRLDPNKGSLTLLDHFRRHVELEGDRVQLVMAGSAVSHPPAQAAVRFLGHVREEERTALLHHALALVAPSPFESLSLALIESWMQSRPVLVNGWCKVLRGQVTRANGGLYYDNAAEFREALLYLEKHPEEADRLGAQGRSYARREYSWPHVIEKLEAFLHDRLESAVLR